MIALGVAFDQLLSFRARAEKLLSQAKIRHGVMFTIARSNWGLKTNVLRQTHVALLISIMRYALPTVGSGLYEADFRRIETKHVNVAARRIVGIGRSARRETL